LKFVHSSALTENSLIFSSLLHIYLGTALPYASRMSVIAVADKWVALAGDFSKKVCKVYLSSHSATVETKDLQLVV